MIAGTRPECIKLAPLVGRLRTTPGLVVRIVNSGQHRQVVTETFAALGHRVDIELPRPAQAPNLLGAFRQLSAGLRRVLDRLGPALVIVQGDTLSAYAGARAGHGAGGAVVHVEAGLRSDDATDPFPEEWFRRCIARHAALHFAPSVTARARLCDEGVDPATIHVVGNTGIDALRAVLAAPGATPGATPGTVPGTVPGATPGTVPGATPGTVPGATPGAAPRAGFGDEGYSRYVLVTLHRRENWDRNADVVCAALVELADAVVGLRIVVAVHPNPGLAARLRRRMGTHPAIALVAPLPYAEFVAAAAGAALLISDSGGLQEEAPHLGVPLLVPRRNTERPEALATGFVRLVAVEQAAIVAAARAALAAPRSPAVPFGPKAPYGAGDAAERIAAILTHWVKQERRA